MRSGAGQVAAVELKLDRYRTMSNAIKD